MSREVRRVPLDWQHPMVWAERWDKDRQCVRPMLVPRALADDFSGAVAKWERDGRDVAERPDPLDYMPDFSDRDPASLGWCMYETCSEGTPISPVLGSPEELARWLTDNGASAFGYSTATYEQWLNVCRGGWAPSAVAMPGVGLVSGVAASALMDWGES